MCVVPSQSSRVVSFAPLPTGEGITSELMAIAKRFGPVKSSLFLPCRVPPLFYLMHKCAICIYSFFNIQTCDPICRNDSEICVLFIEMLAFLVVY